MVSTSQVYIFAAIFGSVFLLLATLISNAIKFEGGSNPGDPRRRRTWFWVMGLLGAVSNVLFGLISYYYPEGNEFAKSKLIVAIGLGAGLCLLIHIVLGFVLSATIKNGKINNWFHLKK